MRVLIVEDYVPLAAAMRRGLEEEGFRVEIAADGTAGLERAIAGTFDAMILDLMLPGIDGLQILRTMRERGGRTPVLVLTAKNTLDDRIRGLDLGADDYLGKPFALEELYARLRALVRRNYQKDPVLRFGHLEINTNDHTVRVGGEIQELSAREYALLEYLAMREGEIVTRADIWAHVYDEPTPAASNVIDVYVGYLRKRIEREGHPKLIHTRRGAGYCFGLRG